jgi:4-hydroxybenzoyl-CoA thioesterase/acyl-CoA thioester hydrolase
VAADFSITRRVQFAETDLAGVLHFANYFRYMEEVEHAFWRSMGLCVISPDGDRTISWPRVAVACEYFAPAHFENELDLRFRVMHVGSRSVGYEIEFVRDGQPIAVGKVTAVCCEMKESRFDPTEIPTAIRTKLLAAHQPAQSEPRP